MSLSVAYAIRKKNSKGGRMSCAHSEGDDGMGSEIAKSIMAKKMAKGGMVEDDDFLSAEDEGSELPEQSDDSLESLEDDMEDPAIKRKSMLKNIMAQISMRK